ncbi:MAG TPA: hypothetical protein VGG06_24805 [Thermoanaerobaculia bacterium]
MSHERRRPSDLLKAAALDASVLPFDLPPGATVTIVFEVTVDREHPSRALRRRPQPL